MDASVCFKVEKVIGISSNDGTYQVQWAPVWVSKLHLVGCEHLIKEFLQQQQQPHQFDEQQPLQQQPQEQIQPSLQQQQPLQPPLQEHALEEESCQIKSEELDVEMSRSSPMTSFDVELPTTSLLIPTDDFSGSDFGGTELSNIERSGGTSTVVKQINLINNNSNGNDDSNDNNNDSINIDDNYPIDIHTRTDEHKVNSTAEKVNVCVKNIKLMSDENMNNNNNKNNNIDLTRPYSCEYCEKTFKEKGNMKSHMRVHTGERPFKCDVCKKSFGQRHHLVNHKLLHTGEKPFSCDICGKTFRSKSNLKVHVRDHHASLKCDGCGETFRTKLKFDYHICDVLRVNNIEHTES